MRAAASRRRRTTMHVRPVAQRACVRARVRHAADLYGARHILRISCAVCASAYLRMLSPPLMPQLPPLSTSSGVAAHCWCRALAVLQAVGWPG